MRDPRPALLGFLERHDPWLAHGNEALVHAALHRDVASLELGGRPSAQWNWLWLRGRRTKLTRHQLGQRLRTAGRIPVPFVSLSLAPDGPCRWRAARVFAVPCGRTERSEVAELVLDEDVGGLRIQLVGPCWRIEGDAPSPG